MSLKVALVCIAKDEDNYIEEWINYHLKLGFDKIVIYANDWNYNNNNKNVIVKHFNGKRMQIPAYNDFIKDNYNKYDYVAFIDVDEFIVLHEDIDIKSFINKYIDYNGIGINWYFFGDNNIKEVLSYNVLERFIMREEKPDKHIKSILKLTKDLRMVSPHNSNKFIVNTDYNIINNAFNYNATNNIVQINHYFCKTFPEFLLKINRGRSDIDSFRKVEEFEIYNKNEVIDTRGVVFYLS